ncbi:hypothetical protein Tco_0252826 [Tanacetum coccineum]
MGSILLVMLETSPIDHDNLDVILSIMFSMLPQVYKNPLPTSMGVSLSIDSSTPLCLVPCKHGDLDNSTSNVLIPLDSWTSRLLVYKLPLSAEYGVSTSIGYGVSNSLSNTAYSLKPINTAYPLPLDTAYRLFGTEAKILTLSLDELRSPDFNLLSDQEYSEEEEAEAMAETMEEYMSKTRADYRSGVVRPKIEEKYSFELTGQFFKELRINTFSGSDHEDVNEHKEKVIEIVDLFHIPNITVDQVMLRAFPMSLTGAAKMQEVVLFYNGLDVPTRQILDSRGAIPSKTTADAKVVIQKMAEYSQKWHNGTSRARSTETSDGLAAIQAQLNNLGREIKKVNEKVYAAQVGCEQCKRPHYTKDCPLKEEGKTLKEAYYMQFEEEEGIYGPKFMEAYGALHINHTIPQKEKDPGCFTLPCFINNVCFDNALFDLGASVSVMPLLTYLNLRLVGIRKFTFPIDFIILDMPEDIKVPLILRRPFLSTARSKIDVYKRKITLRVGEEKIIFKSVKPASSLIRRVYMLSLRERMELDLKAKLMLRRNQGDELMPTIEEGEIIKEFRTRDEDLDTGINDYPSYCDDDKKIHINYAHNLRFSCMIGFELKSVNLFPLLLYVNVMSKKFHNSIMKDKMVYKGNNVVGAVMNVSVFVGIFFVVSGFEVLENMNAYRDEGMGDVIVGEPFLREVGIKAKRFEGIVTLYKNNDEATYQMV